MSSPATTGWWLVPASFQRRRVATVGSCKISHFQTKVHPPQGLVRALHEGPQHVPVITHLGTKQPRPTIFAGLSPSYSPKVRACQLCLTLMSLADPKKTLNKRNEMLSKCRHRDKLLLNQCWFFYTFSLLHQIISPLIPLTLYQNHIKMLCVSLCINHIYTNISTYIYIVYLW